MRKLMCLGSLMVAASFGCGGGGGSSISEGPSVPQGTANVESMSAGVSQAASLNTALAGGNGDAVAASALGLSNIGMSAVDSKSSQFALTVSQALRTINAEAEITGSKSCTATGCTFDNFGVSGGFTLTGSVETTEVADGAKNVVWNLTGAGDSGAFGSGAGGDINFVWNWKGDMTVSPTSIEGVAGGSGKGSGNANGQSFTFTYGSFVKFSAVTLGAAGCPSGGSVTAKWWIHAKAGGQSQTDGAQATHTYTGCQ